MASITREFLATVSKRQLRYLEHVFMGNSQREAASWGWWRDTEQVEEKEKNMDDIKELVGRERIE